MKSVVTILTLNYKLQKDSIKKVQIGTFFSKLMLLAFRASYTGSNPVGNTNLLVNLMYHKMKMQGTRFEYTFTGKKPQNHDLKFSVASRGYDASHKSLILTFLFTKHQLKTYQEKHL